MSYLLLSATVVFLSLQNIFSKQYNVKSSHKNIYLYTALVEIFAMLFFIITSGGRFAPKEGLIWYSAAFSLFYTMAIVGENQAIKNGSLAVSTLITQFSLILPTLYGIVLLKEDISLCGYAGIVLLLISLFAINKTEKNIKISPKWIFWISLAFAGNGMCSIVQKIQQTKFDGACKNEFMITALMMGIVVMLAAAFITGHNLKSEVRDAAKYAPPSGLANGCVNMLIMLLTHALPAAILYPVVCAGGIVVTFIAAVTVYREKFTKRQYVGYLIGVLSVILINL